MEEKLEQIYQDSVAKIKAAESSSQLDEIFIALFGKKGELDLITKEFKNLAKNELTIVGPLLNRIKNDLQKGIEKAREDIKEKFYSRLKDEKLELKIDATMKQLQGHLHLATQFKKEVIDLFSKLGFEQFDAPHVEYDKYNFEDLNIPKEHPSRDMWDTLYIDTKNIKTEPGSMLLRTHTSNFWPRLMEKGKTPIRAMTFDRCFRYEAVDARHSHTFNQFEVAVVGENVSMANLKYLSDLFLKTILGEEARSRFRPKYYPFVEPGVGIDCLCVFCHGKGCKICSGIGWFEIAGAGMIHANVFKATGLDPQKNKGLAWGFGPDRMMMLKYGIEDIRYFLEGDLDFLEKF